MHINKRGQQCWWTLCVISLAGLLFAYVFFEKMLGLIPCPLCILDRIALVIIFVGSSLMLIVQRGYIKSTFSSLGERTIAFCGIVTAFVGVLLGLATSFRHVWIEMFPSTAGCLFPGAKNTMLDYVVNAFAGTADCANASWRFIGLSLAQMTLLLFIVITLVYVFGLVFQRSGKQN